MAHLIKKFENFSNSNDQFKIDAKKLIEDSREYRDSYTEGDYKRILELEKLITDDEGDRREFVKKAMRIFKLSKWEIPDSFYAYI